MGDRNVISKMKEGGANLGGEQSGHIVMSDYSKTGDGILSAIQILAYLVKNNLKASSIRELFKKTPQTLVNVQLSSNKKVNLQSKEVIKFIEKCEKLLGKNGRLLVRKSGTENLIRLMVEGENEELNSKCLNTLVQYFA